MRLVSLLLVLALASLADAACLGGSCSGPAGNSGGIMQRSSRFAIRGRLFNRQPTQAVEQDTVTRTVTRERSLIRRPSAGATVQPQTPAPSQAPAAPKDAPTSKDAAKGASLSPDEGRILVALNQLRAANGRPPVVADPVLMQVASEQLSDPSYSPHNSPRYGSSAQHAARYASFASVNDVVASSHWSDGSVASPESSVDGWRQSPGHLRCILGQSNINNRWIDQGFDRVGIARGGRFDLAVFGRREGQAACDCVHGADCTCGTNCKCGQ